MHLSFPFFRIRTLLLLVGLAWSLLSPPSAVAADCIPFSEARNHVGETKCVRGTIVQVQEGSKGVTYLDYCANYFVCPFTVVVFASDLRQVGDVRQLQGHELEIKGTIREYDGRAEIILHRPQQLGKNASLLPPLPKENDVTRHGRYSAGKFKYPKTPKKSAPKRQGQPAPIEDPTTD
jgi:hypothetical protein